MGFLLHLKEPRRGPSVTPNPVGGVLNLGCNLEPVSRLMEMEEP